MSVVNFSATSKNDNRVIRVSSSIRAKYIIYTTVGVLNEMRYTFHKHKEIYNAQYLKSLKKKIEKYGNIKNTGKFINLVLMYHTLNYHLFNIPIPACPPARSTAHYRCTVCDKKAAKKCGKCNTQYCSEVCQREDWYVHKYECAAIINSIQTYELTSVD